MAVETVTDPKALYDETQWAGVPKYVCKECGYDTLDQGQMIDHVRGVHAEKFERPIKRSKARQLANDAAVAKTNEIKATLEAAAKANAKAEATTKKDTTK